MQLAVDTEELDQLLSLKLNAAYQDARIVGATAKQMRKLVLLLISPMLQRSNTRLKNGLSGYLVKPLDMKMGPKLKVYFLRQLIRQLIYRNSTLAKRQLQFCAIPQQINIKVTSIKFLCVLSKSNSNASPSSKRVVQL